MAGASPTRKSRCCRPGEVCKHLTSRQAVRKRRVKGEFIAFCATVMLADFSYKTDRK